MDRRLVVQRSFNAIFPNVFLGYLIIAGCVCILLAATPGQSFFLGLYTDRFIDTFDMSRASVSSIFSSAFVWSGFTVQIIGKVIDRLGPVRTICIATVPYLCGLALTGTATGPAAITAGFILTRILGPDGIDFTAKVLINRWFQRLRGRAMAVASVTMAVEILLSGGFDRLADGIGWRVATAVAGACSAGLIFVGLLVLFDSPEALGLSPDGGNPARTPGDIATTAASHESCFTLTEACRTCAIWTVAAISFTASTGWGGLNVHMRSVCAEHSLPPAAITART
jgi:MFS family permease